MIHHHHQFISLSHHLHPAALLLIIISSNSGFMLAQHLHEHGTFYSKPCIYIYVYIYIYACSGSCDKPPSKMRGAEFWRLMIALKVKKSGCVSMSSWLYRPCWLSSRVTRRLGRNLQQLIFLHKVHAVSEGNPGKLLAAAMNHGQSIYISFLQSRVQGSNCVVQWCFVAGEYGLARGQSRSGGMLCSTEKQCVMQSRSAV